MLTIQELPILKIKKDFETALKKGPVVVTAPTGSGKSTQIPLWCVNFGSVLVIEPRRVACKGLAARVAQLSNCKIGNAVGYCVRGDNQTNKQTKIIFATPGVVLRWLSNNSNDHIGPFQFNTIIIDEFHERSLDVDLLLALLTKRFLSRLVVMSATMDARRLASHLNATPIHAEGRLFPVSLQYTVQGAELPQSKHIEDNVAQAVSQAVTHPGDILVFLPGKAEINAVERRLSNTTELEILKIHGGLSLKEQSRIFNPQNHRRIILSTNVAETSITVPNVGVVIDCGLVRRTRYVNGRGFLTLVPIAADSADQRAGRSGRTRPGACYRLWSKNANLAPHTPPEIFREALGHLYLACTACNENPRKLPFLDPPKDYALDAAEDELQNLGALCTQGNITPRGRQLFGLPLDAALGSLIVEGQKENCLEDAIDLVSALNVGRPFFKGNKRPEHEDDDLRLCGCDGETLITAVRTGRPKDNLLNPFALDEARLIRRQLREAFNLPMKGPIPKAINRSALLKAAIQSDPRSAYVARNRKGRFFWGNGFNEVILAKESAVNEAETKAILVLGTMAIGQGYRDTKIFATCAMPIRFSNLAKAGLGELEIKNTTRISSGKIISKIERLYAGKVIEKIEQEPMGQLAREAIGALFLQGRLYPNSLETSKKHLADAALIRRLEQAGLTDPYIDLGPWKDTPVPTIEQWISKTLENLGVEQGQDLALLEPDDFVADSLPKLTAEWLASKFISSLKLGDGQYHVEYNFSKREVMLVKVSGTRKNPPSLAVLPSFTGFVVKVKHHSKIWVVKP